jgi:hypothetical protein
LLVTSFVLSYLPAFVASVYTAIPMCANKLETTKLQGQIIILAFETMSWPVENFDTVTHMLLVHNGCVHTNCKPKVRRS